MNKLRCPNCGFMNKPNSRFCQKCGYSLVRNYQPMNYKLRPRKRHHGFLACVNIILISIIVAASVYVYEDNQPVNGVANTTENVSTESSPIKAYWNHINNKVGSSDATGTDTDVDYLFEDGANNYYLKGMKDWLRIDIKPSLEHGTKVTNMTPYDFKDNNGELTYKVRYNFDTNGTHHIEIFNWYASVENSKIVSMKSDKKPTSSYDE